MKTPSDVKAAPLSEPEAWFAGRIPRRILAIPFGGPIPSAKSKRGVDLDDEYFSERTDIFGPHRALRQNRERLVDWSHAARPPGPRYGDPSGMMSGHFLGKSILDPNPEEDGWWADLWLEKGNARVKLIEQLVARGGTLYGSTQPIAPVAKAIDGEITLWPVWLQTLSTAPQNTLSVITPKSALDILPPADSFWTGIEDALRSLGHDLRTTSGMGSDGPKAGQADLADALSHFSDATERVRAVIREGQERNLPSHERRTAP